MGACGALGGNVMTDAFGLVALVAMMPLITVQAMGAIYVVKSRRSEQTAPAAPSATMTSSNSGRWPEMELYCIISITDRSKAQIMQDLYASCGLHMIFTHLGVGTARSEHLSLYGLEATDKAVVTGVASASEERQLLKAAKRRLFIDIPGNGVMLSIPLKSVAGGRTLAYLSDKKDTGGIPDMTFAHELIVAILNEGQS